MHRGCSEIFSNVIYARETSENQCLRLLTSDFNLNLRLYDACSTEPTVLDCTYSVLSLGRINKRGKQNKLKAKNQTKKKHSCVIFSLVSQIFDKASISRETGENQCLRLLTSDFNLNLRLYDACSTEPTVLDCTYSVLSLGRISKRGKQNKLKAKNQTKKKHSCVMFSLVSQIFDKASISKPVFTSLKGPKFVALIGQN